MGAKCLWLGGGSTTSLYLTPSGKDQSNTDGAAGTVVSESGTFSGLRILLPTAPGSGNSYTFTLRKNGVDTGLTCTVAGAATTGSDLANSVAVSAGDYIDFVVSFTGSPSTVSANTTLVFESDTDSWALGGSLPGFNPSSDKYAPLFYGHLSGGSSSSTNSTQMYVDVPGVITAFYGRINVTTLSFGSIGSIKINKNGTTQASATLTPSAGTGVKTMSATGLNISVAAGDVLEMFYDTSFASATASQFTWCTSFEPTNAGEFPLWAGGTSSSFGGGGTNYPVLTRFISNATEAPTQYAMPELELIRGRGKGTNGPVTFTVRKNGSDGNGSVVVNNNSATYTATDAFAEGDLLSTKLVYPGVNGNYHFALTGLLPSAPSGPEEIDKADTLDLAVSEGKTATDTGSTTESLGVNLSESKTLLESASDTDSLEVALAESKTLLELASSTDSLVLDLADVSAGPLITDVTPDVFVSNVEDITITGEFSASGNVVELGDDGDYVSANLVTQTITAEDATEIKFTSSAGSLSGGLFIYVTDADGYVSMGYPVTAANKYSDLVSSDGPVAYWRLGESSGELLDSSGNGHTLNAINSPTYQQTSLLTSDPGNKSLLFERASAERALVDTATSDLNLGDVLSLECWVKLTSLGAYQGLVSQGGGAGYIRISSSNKVEFLRSQVAVVGTGASVLDDDTVYHIVATKNGGSIKIYVNGVDDTGSVSNSTFADSSSVGLAHDLGFTSECLNGVLDEAALYDYALTPEQVLTHYKIGTADAPAVSSEEMVGVDSLALDMSETLSLPELAVKIDSLQVAVGEVLAGADTLGLTDTLSVAGAESGLTADIIQALDSLGVGLAEAKTLLDVYSGADSLVLQIGETRTAAETGLSTDNLLVAVNEFLFGADESVLTDQLDVAASETVAVADIYEAIDSLLVAVGEAKALLEGADVSDTMRLQGIVVAGLSTTEFLAAVESLALEIQELQALSDLLTGADTLVLDESDGSLVADVFDQLDTLSVAVSSVVLALEAAVAEDALPVKTAEGLSGADTVTASDGLGVNVDDDGDALEPYAASESLLLGVIEVDSEAKNGREPDTVSDIEKLMTGHYLNRRGRSRPSRHVGPGGVVHRQRY